MSRSIWCVLLVQHNQDDVPSTWAASVAPTASGCSQQMGPEQHMSPVGWGMWWFQGHNLEKHPEKKKQAMHGEVLVQFYELCLHAIRL